MSDDTERLNIELLRVLLQERRSQRRWKIIRFIFFLIVIAFIIFSLFSSGNMVALDSSRGKGYAAVVKLNGIIEPGGEFSAEQVLPLLKEAFSDIQAKGVVVTINSGGGTPVQASIIHDAIVELKNKYHKKVVIVGEDMMASGAYYIAVAGDKIYVNPNTLTGSIGVIMKGFGFPDLIKKVGVERRVYTAGVNKDRLDPFLPQVPADIEKIRAVITEIHENFKQAVLQGRQNKLRGNPEELFSGDFWSGKSAVNLGLVDDLGNLSDVLQKEFHVTHYRDYSGARNVLKSFMKQFGMTMRAMLGEDSVRMWERI